MNQDRLPECLMKRVPGSLGKPRSVEQDDQQEIVRKSG